MIKNIMRLLKNRFKTLIQLMEQRVVYLNNMNKVETNGKSRKVNNGMCKKR